MNINLNGQNLKTNTKIKVHFNWLAESCCCSRSLYKLVKGWISWRIIQIKIICWLVEPKSFQSKAVTPSSISSFKIKRKRTFNSEPIYQIAAIKYSRTRKERWSDLWLEQTLSKVSNRKIVILKRACSMYSFECWRTQSRIKIVKLMNS